MKPAEHEEDSDTEKYAEFVPSILLSLKSKVTSIMAELRPENKLGGKTVCFPFTLPFPLQMLNSSGGSVKEGDQAVATENAASGVLTGPMVSFSDTEKSYLPSF